MLLAGLLFAAAVAPPPPIMIWVWEWKGDLRWIATRDTGVAFLAAHFIVKAKGDIEVLPRREPFEVRDGAYEMAVVRLDVAPGVELSVWETKFVALVDDVLRLMKPRALQIDFDARESQRDAYRHLLGILREKTKGRLFLSITALQSWCTSSTWTASLPVDEVVPMAFREYKPFSPTTCSQSIGLSVGERHDYPRPRDRVYLFTEYGERLADIPSYIDGIRAWK